MRLRELYKLLRDDIEICYVKDDNVFPTLYSGVVPHIPENLLGYNVMEISAKDKYLTTVFIDYKE